MSEHNNFSCTMDGEKFIQVCRLTPTSVNIVSTNGTGGLMAQTISAFMTASYHPPRIAISIQSKSPMISVIEKNQSFTVNLLADSHDHIADSFAGKPWPGQEKWDFNCGFWHFPEKPEKEETSSDPQCISIHSSQQEKHEKFSTAPYLIDAVAVLSCRIFTMSSLGSHVMYIGTVGHISYRDSLPLVYHNSNYCSPTRTTSPRMSHVRSRS